MAAPPVYATPRNLKTPCASRAARILAGWSPCISMVRPFHRSAAADRLTELFRHRSRSRSAEDGVANSWTTITVFPAATRGFLFSGRRRPIFPNRLRVLRGGSIAAAQGPAGKVGQIKTGEGRLETRIEGAGWVGDFLFGARGRMAKKEGLGNLESRVSRMREKDALDVNEFGTAEVKKASPDNGPAL